MTPNRPRDRSDDDRGERTPDPGAVFDALATDHRRRAVRALIAADGAVSIDELARRVVSRERVASPAAVSPSALQRATTRLHHADLPKLEDAGLVDYDHRRREIRPLVDWAHVVDVVEAELDRPDQ